MHRLGLALLTALTSGTLALSATPAWATTGHITGTVSADGDLRDDVTVTAYAVGSASSAASADTDSNGHYDLALAPGDYHVRFSQQLPAEQYVTEWWDDADRRSTATTVTVGGGVTVSGVDADLGEFRTISGRVTVPGGAGLETDVEVWQHNPDTDEWNLSWEYFPDWDEEGNYSLYGIAPGDYRIEFLPYGSDYRSEFWDDAQSFASATTVTVARDADVTGVDAALAPASHITGRVTSLSGTGVEHVEVTALAYDGEQWIPTDDSALSAEDGSYDVGDLGPGTYRVQFSADGYATEYWDDVEIAEDADDVVILSPGEVISGVDAELASVGVPDGAITGRVSTGAGTGIDDIRVAAFRFDPDQVGSDWYPDGWVFWDYTYTAPNGTYTLAPLEPADYRIQFYDRWSDVYTTEYWDDAPTLEEAQDVTVAPGVVTEEINAVLASGASISGTVTTGRSQFFSYSDVVLYRLVDGAFEFADLQYAYDDEATFAFDGTYEFSNVAPGTYRIKFALDEGYADEYWNDKPTLASADDIVVTAGATITGKNAHLEYPAIVNQEPPQINGTPQVGATLTAIAGTWTPSPSYVDYVWSVAGTQVAEGVTYQPTVDDLGKTITVRATASRSNYKSASATSAAVGPVQSAPPPPSVANTSPPVVTGTPKVGELLDASQGGWSPQPSQTTYQWFAGGVAVAGATEFTYRVRPADVGKSIRVAVTATATGWSPATAMSEPTNTVSLGTIRSVLVPRMFSRPRVGRAVRADPGTWAPTTVTLTYQWFVDGATVRRATKVSFTPKARHLGKKLVVVVTASSPGYAPLKATSAARKVKPAA